MNLWSFKITGEHIEFILSIAFVHDVEIRNSNDFHQSGNSFRSQLEFVEKYPFFSKNTPNENDFREKKMRF